MKIEWDGIHGATPSGWGVLLEVGRWGDPVYRVNFYQPGSKSHIPDRAFDVEVGDLEDLQADAEDLAEEMGI